jgi:hypothetical protein
MHFPSITLLATLSLTLFYSHSNCAAISQHNQKGHPVPRDNLVSICVSPKDSTDQTQTAAIEKYINSITDPKLVHRFTFFDDPPEVIRGWTIMADPSTMKGISSQPGVIEVVKSGEDGDRLELDREAPPTSPSDEIRNVSWSIDESSQFGATPSRIKRNLAWNTQASAPWHLVSISQPS